MRRSITVFPKLSDKEVSAIVETRKQYARAFNMSAECLISHSSTSRRFLHEVQYERIKEECPSLPTGLIQCARDVAVEAVKAWMECHRQTENGACGANAHVQAFRLA